MSYKATNWAYELPLRGAMKPVLVALADMADEAGSCFPSQERIARMTGYTSRTVRVALKNLAELGLIKRVPRYGGTEGRKTDRYVLSVGSELPEDSSTGNSFHRKNTSELPENNVISTGSSFLGTIREPSENHQYGQVVASDAIDEGTSRAKPFPSEFFITQAMKAWAEKTVPGLNLDHETSEFVGYWRDGEGKGKKKKNWIMAWQNRMRQQHKYLPPADRQLQKKVRKF